MENKQPTLKDHIIVLERAIDVAVSKGCYNKIETVQLVQSLSALYEHEAKQNSDAVAYKGIKEN